jgi:DNA-nicking Smr family endonuclease
MASRRNDPKHPFAALGALKDAMAKEQAAKSAPTAHQKTPAPKQTAAERSHVPTSTPEEDELSFHRMISGVTPLHGSAGRVPRTGDAEPAPPRLPRESPEHRARREAEEVHEHLRQLVEGGARFEVSDDGRRVEGRRVDIGPDLVRKLRRGHFPIDARLDLHGLHASEARAAVEQFLREKRARRERCVLLIHGKGEHSSHVPVLRGEIAAWLSQGRASEQVAAFSTALAEDGGEGAVYVLLRA